MNGTITLEGREQADAHACAVDALADHAHALSSDAGSLQDSRLLFDRIEVVGALGCIVPSTDSPSHLSVRQAYLLRETAQALVSMIDNFLDDTDHYGMPSEWAESLRPARGRAQRVLHALTARGIRGAEAVPS